jgi:hypothetical protein
LQTTLQLRLPDGLFIPQPTAMLVHPMPNGGRITAPGITSQVPHGLLARNIYPAQAIVPTALYRYGLPLGVNATQQILSFPARLPGLAFLLLQIHDE